MDIITEARDKILIKGLTFGGVNYGDVVSHKEYTALLTKLEEKEREVDGYKVSVKELSRINDSLEGLKAENERLENNNAELAKALRDAASWFDGCEEAEEYCAIAEKYGVNDV